MIYLGLFLKNKEFLRVSHDILFLYSSALEGHFIKPI